MDWFLLVFLIPLILVPVVLLCGFAGCAQIADLGHASDPPAAPSSLVAKTAGASRVSLSWKDNSGGTVNFVVLRTTIGPDGAGVLSPVPGEIKGIFFTDTGLTEGTTFLYQVEAVDSDGQPSAGSNFADATTFRTTQPPTWHTAYEIPLTTNVHLTPNGGTWADTCMVQRISADRLTFGGTKVRITLRGSTESSFVIDKVSISPAASGSHPWQSIEAPINVPATGAPGVTLSANTAKIMDPVDYLLDPTKDLIIAFDINNAGGDAIMAGVPKCDFYFLENTHQATAKTRSSSFGNNKNANTVFLVEKIEVL
jgi:hypothetical protein